MNCVAGLDQAKNEDDRQVLKLSETWVREGMKMPVLRFTLRLRPPRRTARPSGSVLLQAGLADPFRPAPSTGWTCLTT